MVSLVTGGAGFIGSHLTEALVARGGRVRVLDDFSTGRRDNLDTVRDRVELIEGSVTDREAVAAAMQGVQWVFHLAALPSVQRSVEDPEATHEACVTGTLRVLSAARAAGVRRVVYAASSSAYGDTPGMVRKEDDPVAPLSPYAAAKLAGEHYCRCFTATYGLETVRLRFFNIFGPRQNPYSPYSGVIARFIAAMTAGQPPIIYGDGLQSRDFTYVDNAVQALLRAAEAPAAVGNVYNIGSGGTVRVLDLVARLNELLGTTLQPVHHPPRPGDVRHSQADISRARRDLGYEPTVSFPVGLRRTLEAFRRMTKPE
ncbi:MAG TPA: SDR family oxidoreductase [Gemmataceae bacterium]|nr:SDR family oxidoreductase [Gemmataceae bacterium]